MKFTNFEIGNYVDILSTLQESGKLGFAIARNLRKMSDEAKEYLDLRAKLMQKYGTRSADGKSVSIDPVKNPTEFAAYTKEMGDIPQVVLDIDIFKVDADAFCSGNLTSNQMSVLLWMVDDDDPKKGD